MNEFESLAEKVRSGDMPPISAISILTSQLYKIKELEGKELDSVNAKFMTDLINQEIEAIRLFINPTIRTSDPSFIFPNN